MAIKSADEGLVDHYWEQTQEVLRALTYHLLSIRNDPTAVVFWLITLIAASSAIMVSNGRIWSINWDARNHIQTDGTDSCHGFQFFQVDMTGLDRAPSPILSETGNEGHLDNHRPDYKPWCHLYLILVRRGCGSSMSSISLLPMASKDTGNRTPNSRRWSKRQMTIPNSTPRRSLAIWPTNWTDTGNLEGCLLDCFSQYIKSLPPGTFSTALLTTPGPETPTLMTITPPHRGRPRHKGIISTAQYNEFTLSHWICLGSFSHAPHVLDSGRIDPCLGRSDIDWRADKIVSVKGHEESN